MEQEAQKEQVEGVDYIVLKVYCIGCTNEVTPDEVDWDLFRIGINVHTNEKCYSQAEQKLQAAHG